MRPDRRRFLATLGAGASLAACGRESHPSAPSTRSLLDRLGFATEPATYEGGWIGQSVERGHRLRDLGAVLAPDETRRTSVLIIGGGIAGLAAARALAASGIDDYRILELEDEAGGNSRGALLGGMACPLGAHYLPTPGPYADEVAALLTEYRLRAIVEGKARYDERTLCAAPQERLWIAGGWQDGLLPVRGVADATLADYRRFAALVRAAQSQPRAYTMPTAASAWSAGHAALDAQSFAQWLDSNGLHAPPLRWYLDYCCRDDYGAPAASVSAWAGLHYFASRHGFSAPGDREEADRDFENDGVLTWPEGNAWLARRLAAPHAARTQTGALVLRVTETRSGVEAEVLDIASGRITRWQADRAILATPLFIATRLVTEPPAALSVAAEKLPHAPWLVANLLLDGALAARHGDAPLSWDNVLYEAPGLGYVNARNQIPEPYAGATVLTYYRALGDDPIANRRALLVRDWREWSEAIVDELSAAHPDLRAKLRRVELMRYGHAMAIPAPGMRGADWLAALRRPIGRLAFAHADLSAYSVFEEAFHWGLAAGGATAAALRGGATRTSLPR